MTISPLAAADIMKVRTSFFPEAVYAAVNEMLQRKFNSRTHRAVIKQDELVALMVQKGLDEGEIFANNWLDFEEVYRDHGWTVTYEKSDYTDQSPSTYTFAPIRLEPF
jgi:hypothetical protein